MSDIDTAAADSLKVLDPERPIREAVIEARYIRTGAKAWPQIEELRRACNRVRDDVGGLLVRADVPVRLGSQTAP